MGGRKQKLCEPLIYPLSLLPVVKGHSSLGYQIVAKEVYYCPSFYGVQISAKLEQPHNTLQYVGNKAGGMWLTDYNYTVIRKDSEHER